MSGRQLRKRKLQDEVSDNPKLVQTRRRIKKVEDNEPQVPPAQVRSDIVSPRKMKKRKASARHRHASLDDKPDLEQHAKQEVKAELYKKHGQEDKYSRAVFAVSADTEDDVKHHSKVKNEDLDDDSDLYNSDKEEEQFALAVNDVIADTEAETDDHFAEDEEEKFASAANDAIAKHDSEPETDDDLDGEDGQFASAVDEVIKVARELGNSAPSKAWKCQIGDVLRKHFPAPTPPSNKEDDGVKNDAGTKLDDWQLLDKASLKAQAAEAWECYYSSKTHLKCQTSDAAADLKGESVASRDKEWDADLERIKERARADTATIVDMMGAVLKKRVGQLEEAMKVAMELEVQRLGMQFGDDVLGGSLGDSELW